MSEVQLASQYLKDIKNFGQSCSSISLALGHLIIFTHGVSALLVPQRDTFASK